MLSAFADNYIDLGDLQKARQRAQECVDIARPLQRTAEDKARHVRARWRGCLEKLANALAARSLFNDVDQGLSGEHRAAPSHARRRPGQYDAAVELGHILTYYAFAH